MVDYGSDEPLSAKDVELIGKGICPFCEGTGKICPVKVKGTGLCLTDKGVMKNE